MGNYSGFGLPWDGTLQTFVEPKEDIDILRSSVLWILMTRRGERVMLPEFGSAIPDALFNPNDDITRDDIQYDVQNAVEVWDSRVQFKHADIKQDGHDIMVRVEFRDAGDPLSEELASLEVTARPELI